MKLTPLHDRIVVEVLDPETRTSSGLIIPDNAAEKPTQGKVIAAGPGSRNSDGTILSMAVNVGDIVLFGKFAGNSVKIDGKEFTIMREEDVFAVVEQ